MGSNNSRQQQIENIIQHFSQPGLQMRQLQIGDYDKGFFELLNQLTSAEKVSKETFINQFHEIQKTNTVILVFEDLNTKKLLASGTIMMECKFIRNCGIVGHIEDIVVSKDVRGKNLGFFIVQALTRIGFELGKCYKVILDCNFSNVPFYNKLQYESKGAAMTIYFQEYKNRYSVNKGVESSSKREKVKAIQPKL